MTLPYERRRAIQWAGEILRELRSEHRDIELWGVPIPDKLREVAARVLRHYPTPEQIEAAIEMDDLPVCDWIAREPD